MTTSPTLLYDRREYESHKPDRSEMYEAVRDREADVLALFIGATAYQAVALAHVQEEADDVATTPKPSISSRIVSRQLFLFFAGLVGAIAGLLVATPLAIIAAGLFMFLSGAMGHVGSERKATWLALEAGGLGIALLAAIALIVDLIQ